MIQPIVLYGTNGKYLRTPCSTVTFETDTDKALINKVFDDLIDTVKYTNGLGLAANQISINKRLCVVNYNGEFIKMINPECIVPTGSDDFFTATESCLSLPDIVVKVKRYSNIVVEYIDPTTWRKRELTIKDEQAAIFQHELSHLNGKLIIDELKPLQRQLIENKLKRISRGTMPLTYVGMVWKENLRKWIMVGSEMTLRLYAMYLNGERLGVNKDRILNVPTTDIPEKMTSGYMEVISENLIEEKVE